MSAGVWQRLSPHHAYTTLLHAIPASPPNFGGAVALVVELTTIAPPAPFSAGRKVACPGRAPWSALQATTKKALVDYTVPESPSHVTEVHGMEARDAQQDGEEPHRAGTSSPTRSAPPRTDNADRRHARHGATHGDRSAHARRLPTQTPEARGRRALPTNRPKKKSAEMRTDTETSTAGELNVHRAPRRPRQVLHAGGPGERQVQRAGEPGGL